jgi:[acyl-carrier-protein] S-malonyltransferase
MHRRHGRRRAGHSLGEFTAYHASDALPFAEAVRLVRRRGELMLEAGEAASRRDGCRSRYAHHAHRRDLLEASEDAGPSSRQLQLPGQIVISGESAGVDRAMELVKLAGGKAKKLQRQRRVSLATHGVLRRRSGERARPRALRDSRFPVYANVNAQP